MATYCGLGACTLVIRTALLLDFALTSAATPHHYGRRDVGGVTREFFPRIVKWLAILTIVLNFDAMVILLSNLFTGEPEIVATQIADVAGGTVGDSNFTVSIVWSQVLEFAQIIFADVSFTPWSRILFFLLVLIIAILAVVYLASLIMLYIIAVAILLGCAPFFLLYLFNTARPSLQRQ